MIRLQEIIEACNELWPEVSAEAWDVPGLLVGNPDSPISKVHFAVDVTAAVVEEACNAGANLLIAHHPYLLKPTSSLSENTSKGALLSRAIRSNLAIYSAHTNADTAEHGVSAEMARRIGLSDAVALEPLGEKIGLGRVGILDDPITLGTLARVIANVLPPTATGVRVAGDFNQLVSRVALCAGAGDSLIANAFDAKADVYVTADLRHHRVQDARESAALNGDLPAVIDVSHWASEWLWLDIAAGQLQSKFAALEFEVSDLRTDPWDFVITQ